MLVEKYLLGELGGADLEDFEVHMFECSICFQQVKAGQEFVANISADAPCNGPRRSRRVPHVVLGISIVVATALLLVMRMHPLSKFFTAVPFLVAGGCFLAMLLSMLWRYSERWREFWAARVCAFMEEHGSTRDETKGGM
jgi:hypothetical protein